MDCPKRSKPKEVNLVDDITKDVSNIDLTTIIFEVNLVGSKPKEWWGKGATRHICYDKKMLSTFELIKTKEKLFMGNSTASEIKGQWKMVLKVKFGKELTLTNVLYVPEIYKNLVFG